MNIDTSEFEKRLRESEVKALDDYELGIREAPVMYKATGSLVKATDDMMVFVASEESNDRLGDVIEVNGWELDNFKKNPVFMFIHQHNTAPLGRVPKIWKEGKQLLNTVEWDEADPLASFVKGKYERKFMKAVSVGFRPIEFERIDSEKDAFGAFRFKSQELLEISAVPIPAHPKALQRAVEMKSLFFTFPDLELKEEPSLSSFGISALFEEKDTTEPIPEPEPEPEGDESDEELVVAEQLSELVKEEEAESNVETGPDEIPVIENQHGALSKANRERISRAAGLLQSVLDSPDASGEDSPPEPEGDKDKDKDKEIDEVIVAEADEPEQPSFDLDKVLAGIRGLKELGEEDEIVSKEDLEVL